MVLFGWPFHSAITHMGDKTCCQSWWTILELLVEFDSFYFGCFLFQTQSISLFFLSAACPLTLPLTSFCHESRTGLRNLCRRESELQKAKQLPELVPLWGLLKEQHGRLWPELVQQSHPEYCGACYSISNSLPFVPFACGAESHGCRFLPVINRNALHRHRLYALGIEPTLLWSSESFCRLTQTFIQIRLYGTVAAYCLFS